MRGPGFRRDLDVRRTWKCPACGSELRVGGDVSTVRCDCQPAGVWMRIQSERNAVPREPRPASPPEIPVADFQLTEEELATPLEGRVRRRMPLPPPPQDQRRGPGQRSPQEPPRDAHQEPPVVAEGPAETSSRPQRKKERPPRERGRSDPGNRPPDKAASIPPVAPASGPQQPPPHAPKLDADDPFADGLE